MPLRETTEVQNFETWLFEATLALARSLLGISFVVLYCVVVVLSAVHRKTALNP